MKEGLGKRAALLGAVVVLAALAPAPSGVSGAKLSNKLLTYAGQTSFGRPLVLEVRRGAITRLGIAWEASCVTTGTLPFAGVLHRRTGSQPDSVDPDLGFLLYGGRLTRLGGFSGTGLGTIATDPFDYELNQTISGRVKTKRASGRWRVRADVLNTETDATEDSCKTSTFSWSATRSPGRVFGGFTSQNSPVVADFNKARTTLSALRIAWSAPCSDENPLGFGTTIASVPVTGGRFSVSRTVEGTPDGETPTRFAYTLEGSVSRSRVSGTFEVTATSVEDVEVTCTSPTIDWNATST